MPNRSSLLRSHHGDTRTYGAAIGSDEARHRERGIPAGQVHPPAIAPILECQYAPDRWFNVTGIPLVGPATISVPVPLQFFSGPGLLIGWRGTSIDFTVGAFAAGAFEQATMGVQAVINDGEVLTTDGNQQDFIRYSDLYPPGTVYSPIMREVRSTDTLNLTFQNFQPAVGGVALQPTMSFLFRRFHYPGT